MLGALKRLEDVNAEQLYAILQSLEKTQPAATRLIIYI